MRGVSCSINQNISVQLHHSCDHDVGVEPEGQEAAS